VRDGETGYLVPVGDHEQLAQHIVSLLLDQESAGEMGDSGRRRVNEKFSSAKQLQNVESLYTELLTSSTPAWVSRLSRVDPN